MKGSVAFVLYGKSVLVVDDDAGVRRSVAVALAAAGCDAYEACEGGAAIDMLERTYIDLAVIDLVMPGKEGLETIIEAKRRWPDLKVIAISGGADAHHDYLGIARSLGADATMVKPLNLKDMQERIERLLTPAPAA